MSNIYSFGLDAYLTLGNKKAVDIVLRRPNGNTLSLESKGVNKKSDDWPLSNREIYISCNIIYVLISCESNIHDVTIQPNVWIIPESIIAENSKASVFRNGKNLYYISHKYVREELVDYQNNWKLKSFTYN